MKALQSPLAKKVLADNQARMQLRQVVSLASRQGQPDASEQTILLREGATVRRLSEGPLPVVIRRRFWHYPAHCRPHRTEPS